MKAVQWFTICGISSPSGLTTPKKISSEFRTLSEFTIKTQHICCTFVAQIYKRISRTPVPVLSSCGQVGLARICIYVPNQLGHIKRVRVWFYSKMHNLLYQYCRKKSLTKTITALYAKFERDFYILIMDEKVLVLCEKWLSKFSSNLYVLRPPESEKTVFTKVSVCLSVCLSVGRVRHNSR